MEALSSIGFAAGCGTLSPAGFQPTFDFRSIDGTLIAGSGRTQ